jgi:hypothetical protein
VNLISQQHSVNNFGYWLISVFILLSLQFERQCYDREQLEHHEEVGTYRAMKFLIVGYKKKKKERKRERKERKIEKKERKSQLR